jgi:hypothetical protein
MGAQRSLFDLIEPEPTVPEWVLVVEQRGGKKAALVVGKMNAEKSAWLDANGFSRALGFRVVVPKSQFDNWDWAEASQ